VLEGVLPWDNLLVCRKFDRLNALVGWHGVLAMDATWRVGANERVDVALGGELDAVSTDQDASAQVFKLETVRRGAREILLPVREELVAVIIGRADDEKIR
jgi:hypothetical protein